MSAQKNVEMVKKITPKVVCGDVKTRAVGFLCRIIGVAFDTKTVNGPYGEALGLKGKFMAVDGATGKQFVSNVCYLPEFVLLPVISELRDPKNKVESVQFAYDLFKTASEKSATGYEYTVKPVLKPTEQNPLENIVGTLPPMPTAEGEADKGKAADKGKGADSKK